MQSLVNIYCLEKLIRGVQNHVIYLSVICIFLGITAVVGNTLFLIALHKNTSLHQPSKVLLRNLVASRSLHWFRATYFRCFADLHSVRMVANLSSSLFRQWYSSQPFDNSIFVDRLLVLLLKLRYKQVFTIRKVYAVAIASWLCNGISTATLWFFSLDAWKVLLGTNIAVCLITSTYSYTRTFYMMRHQHAQLHDNLREPENQTSREGMARYRKIVFSLLWLLLALLFSY